MNLNGLRVLKKSSKFGTLASEISNKKIYENENVVKVITKENLDNINFPEAINFIRKNEGFRHFGKILA